MSEKKDSRQRRRGPGQPPGEEYLRVRREDLEEGLRRATGGRLVATEQTEEQATGRLGALVRKATIFVTGRPLKTEAQEVRRAGEVALGPVRWNGGASVLPSMVSGAIVG